jgi:hypothetical protein
MPAAGSGPAFPGSGPGFPSQGAPGQFGNQPGPGYPPTGQFGNQPGPGYPPPGQAYPQAPGQPIGMGPRRPRRTRLFIRLGILAVVVIVGIVIAVINSHSDPAGASVGQCLSGDLNSADSVKQTDCTANNAAYKVLAVLDNKSESDYNSDSICTDVPNADAVFWEGHDGESDGTILCLQKLGG